MKFIKAFDGSYVRADAIAGLYLREDRDDGIGVFADATGKHMYQLESFDNEAEAQKYLDALVAELNGE